MAATRSRLVSGVYQYLNGAGDSPLPDGLPMQTVYEVLTEIESEMLRDLDLSDQSRTVRSEEVNLSTSSFSLSASDFGSPSYVQVRINPDDTFWQDVDIVNHGSLNRARSDGRLAVSFFGTPQTGEVSWLPDGEAHRLRIWYDRTPDEDGDLDDSPVVGDAYLSHLKLQAAAQCRELMGLPIGDVLITRLAKGEKQWHKFVNMSRQQGVIEKKSWTPPRWRRSYGGSRYGEGGFRLP